MKLQENFKFLYSINELMTLTGKSFRTLKKRLDGVKPHQADGNGGIIYDLREVLPLIYRIEVPKCATDFRLLRDKSEARLAAAKAQKLKLEVDLMKKKLIPLENAEKQWAMTVASCRARILALPSRAALILHDLETVQELEITLKEFVHEVLEELSKDGASVTGELGEGAPIVGAASEVETE